MTEQETKAAAEPPLDCRVSPLPCPFCGSTPVVHETKNDGWWVDCIDDDCPTQPQNQRPRHREEDAIADWNKRANA